MGNPKLIPYETIVRATSGEPEAVEEVLRHYSRRIRLAALENGHVNTDTEDSIKQRLMGKLFQLHSNNDCNLCFSLFLLFGCAGKEI